MSRMYIVSADGSADVFGTQRCLYKTQEKKLYISQFAAIAQISIYTCSMAVYGEKQ